jgi:hypothetical protein
MAGKKKFEDLLSRRIMGEQGWLFFCRLCGKYQPEEQFYKKKGGKWGLDSKCKIHYHRKDKDEDPEMDYLKLDPIREEDFKNTAELLCSLGYNFDNGISIHKQFCKKHNLPC